MAGTWKCTLSTPCSWASSVPRFTWAGDSVIPAVAKAVQVLPLCTLPTRSYN